jgi:hypothetical protein
VRPQATCHGGATPPGVPLPLPAGSLRLMAAPGPVHRDTVSLRPVQVPVPVPTGYPSREGTVACRLGSFHH